MYKKLHNCMISKCDTEIIVPWIDDKSDPWYHKYGSYHTGVDIRTNDVYNICSGVVIFIDTTSKSIVVQYDYNMFFRYVNIYDICVSLGDPIKKGVLLGHCKDYVHFEYLTLRSTDTRWPFRISGLLTLYKNDPTSIIDGTLVIAEPSFEEVTIVSTNDYDTPELSLEMSEEFGDNTGGDSPVEF